MSPLSASALPITAGSTVRPIPANPHIPISSALISSFLSSFLSSSPSRQTPRFRLIPPQKRRRPLSSIPRFYHRPRFRRTNPRLATTRTSPGLRVRPIQPRQHSRLHLLAARIDKRRPPAPIIVVVEGGVVTQRARPTNSAVSYDRQPSGSQIPSTTSPVLPPSVSRARGNYPTRILLLKRSATLTRC